MKDHSGLGAWECPYMGPPQDESQTQQTVDGLFFLCCVTLGKVNVFHWNVQGRVYVDDAASGVCSQQWEVEGEEEQWWLQNESLVELQWSECFLVFLQGSGGEELVSLQLAY